VNLPEPIMQQQQPQGRLPEEEKPTILPTPPVCLACGKAMHLKGSSPSPHYANLDQLKYACDCGGAAEKTIAHRDLRTALVSHTAARVRADCTNRKAPETSLASASAPGLLGFIRR